MTGAEPLHIPTIAFEPERLLRTLDDHEVDYILIGGLASTLHGSPLGTIDADITPARSPENLQALSGALEALGAQLRVPGNDYGVPVDLAPGWFGVMTTITFITTAGMLDVAFRPDGQPRGYDDLIEGAISLEVFGRDVRIAALDDIIASKRAANRPKDHHALPYLEELRRQLGGDADG